jgi:hypothetical protein
MVDEDAEYTFEVAAVRDQEPVEAFGADWCGRSARRSRWPSALAWAS